MKSPRSFFRSVGRIHFRFLLLTAVLLVLSTFACTKDDDNFYRERRVEGRISFLDVQQARGFAIGLDEGAGKYANLDPSSTTLFKITENGVVQEIRYWIVDTVYIETKEGTEMRIDSTEASDFIYPVFLLPAGEDFLIACFNEADSANPELFYEYDYLVRLADGKVYQLPYGYRPLYQEYMFGGMFKNEGPEVLVQQDDAGNIYYIGKGDILKINVQNPENIQVEQLTNVGGGGEGVSNFRVNGAGSLLFNAGGVSTGVLTRMRFTNGALAYPSEDVIPFWLGFDNEFYFANTQASGSAAYARAPFIKRLETTNNQLSYVTIDSIGHPEALECHLDGSFLFRLKAHNKIVAMQLSDHMGQKGKVVSEVYNNTMAVQSSLMSNLGISQVLFSAHSDNFYYLSGFNANQPVVLKVDPTNFPHTASSLLPTGAYDVSMMTVSADDYLLIGALRMSDGNQVIIQIDPSGNQTVMSDIGLSIYQLISVN